MLSKANLARLVVIYLYMFLTVLTISVPALAGKEPSWVNPLDRYSMTCKERVLHELGWTIVDDATISSPQLSHDPYCFAAAQPNGWLPHNVLKLPPAFWDEILGKVQSPKPGSPVMSANTALDIALRSDGSQCMFQQKFNRDIRGTIDWLSSWYNVLYQFPVWTNKDVWLGDVKYWHQVGCVTKGGNGGSDTCYAPEQAHLTQAIENLEKQPVAVDCSVGVDLAEYIALARVFGPQLAAAFGDFPFRERANSPVLNARFYVGHDAYESPSALMGKYSVETFNGPHEEVTFDWSGRARAALGPQAFIGAMGDIKSAYGPKFIDDANNKAENFIIDDVNHEALAALMTAGGVQGFDRSLSEIWRLAEKLRDEVGPAGLESLVELVKFGEILPTDGLPLPIRVIAAMNRNVTVVKETYFNLAPLLNNPFLRSTKVYVHPLGVEPISYHILRLALINPRTPFLIRFNYDTIHGEIFNRWLKVKLDRCK